MRATYFRRCFSLAAGLGLVLGASGPAKAALTFGLGLAANPTINVRIDDLTGTITATTNGGGSSISHFTNQGEFVAFLLKVPEYTESPVGRDIPLATASRDMLEPPGFTTFSDRLFVGPWSSTELAVSFGSDRQSTFLGVTQFTPLREDGTFQPMFFATLTGSGPTTVVQFTAASDVPRVVPEGSTIVMAASALPMALGFWWRKRRQAIA